MIDSVSVACGKHVEVIYQTPNEGDDIAEPAIIILQYEGDPDMFGLIQGDNEILVAAASMPTLIKALKAWHKKATA